MSTTDSPEFITIPEAARIREVQVNTIEKWVARGLLTVAFVAPFTPNSKKRTTRYVYLSQVISTPCRFDISRENRTLMASGKKRCSRCKNTKPLSDFAKCHSQMAGIKSWCRACNRVIRTASAGTDKAMPRDLRLAILYAKSSPFCRRKGFCSTRTTEKKYRTVRLDMLNTLETGEHVIEEYRFDRNTGKWSDEEGYPVNA